MTANASIDGAPTYALVVTVDYEDVQFLHARDADAARRDKSRSVFSYGTRRGVDALLTILSDRATAATWFVPGIVARDQPAVVREIHAAGHEIATPGDSLETLDELSPRERHESLRAARDSIAEVTGEAPTGFRLASGRWPHGLASTLADLGFEWSSSLGGDDSPFPVPAGRGRTIIELPRLVALDDRVAFFWNFSPPFPAGQSRIASYDDTLDNWRYELRGARAGGQTVVLTLHPEISGTPGRRQLIHELLSDPMAAAAQRPTGRQLAARFRNDALRRPNDRTALHADDHHPIEMLLSGLGAEAL